MCGMARIPSREHGISQQLQQLARQVDGNKGESEDAWLVFRLVSVGSYVPYLQEWMFRGGSMRDSIKSRFSTWHKLEP